MRSHRHVLALALALAAAACAEPATEAELATDLPPGAASKADGQLDLVANHCELFVDRVAVSRSSHALLRLRVYVKSILAHLDGEIAEVGYYGQLRTERPGASCGDGACRHHGEWRAYPAIAWFDADDYFSLDFTLSHDFTAPLLYEGAFYLRTTAGTTYWVNPSSGGNFFLDTNLAHDVENHLGGFSYSRGIDPSAALPTAGRFPYLNARGCR